MRELVGSPLFALREECKLAGCLARGLREECKLAGGSQRYWQGVASLRGAFSSLGRGKRVCIPLTEAFLGFS